MEPRYDMILMAKGEVHSRIVEIDTGDEESNTPLREGVPTIR